MISLDSFAFFAILGMGFILGLVPGLCLSVASDKLAARLLRYLERKLWARQ
jgi:predicted Kef-type K+ transport protein